MLVVFEVPSLEAETFWEEDHVPGPYPLSG